MKTIMMLVFGLILAGLVQAQVGSSISADGSSPNNNAMLDIKSPVTGDGKGMLIPRVTEAQRTTASSALAGGLLDNSGNLRGAAAQGLIVYQIDGVQGLVFQYQPNRNTCLGTSGRRRRPEYAGKDHYQCRLLWRRTRHHEPKRRCIYRNRSALGFCQQRHCG